MPFERNLELEIQRLRSAVDELTLLNELALAASSSLEVDQILETIVKKSVKSVKAEQGAIMLVTARSESPLKTLIRKEDNSEIQSGYRVSASITGWVLKNKQPLFIEDLEKDPRFNLSDKEKGEIRSILCVPILSKGNIIGVLTMTNKKEEEAFSQNDLRLLSIIAAQSGQLIINSELQLQAVEKKRLEHQLDLARDIQNKLLPEQHPVSELYEIASYFQPADIVGGDYYDFFQTREGQLGVVIADVSGHGVPAALVMTLLKGALHASAYDFRSPEMVLNQVNEILSTLIPQEMFITMQILVIDVVKKNLQIANAGHNPLLHYSKEDKKCHMIEWPGCGLNLLPGYEYNCTNIELNSGDVIVIYTDGITEAFDAHSEMYDISRLCDAVENSNHQSAKSIIHHIRNDLDTFVAGTGQEDDQVLIVVKIK